MDCDRLILIAVVLDNTLNQYVKWLAQEDIVCRVANDVKLNVQRDVSNKDGHIAGEAYSLINFTVCQLHAETDTRVIDESQRMTHSFRHGNDLGTGVEDRFNILVVVD